MYNNNGFYNQNQNYYGGYPQPNVNYAQQQAIKVPQFYNMINEEQRKLLQQSNTQFSLSLEPIEVAKAKCTHCNTNGIVIQQLTNGDWECPICHEVFRDVEQITEEALQDAIGLCEDTMQWLKLKNAAAQAVPQQSMSEYVNILPLWHKMPTVWKIVSKQFANLPIGGFNVSQNSNINPFLQLNGLVGNGQYGTMNNPYAQPAYMNNMNPGYYNNNTPYGNMNPQQMYQQQPAYNNMMGNGGNMDMNVSFQSMMNPQPQQQMYQQPQPGFNNMYQQNAYYPNGSNPLDISSQNNGAFVQTQSVAPAPAPVPTIVNGPVSQQDNTSTEAVQQHKTFSM